MSEDPDRVEKTIDLRAPPARVWQAISRPGEFGAWFGLGDPFVLVGDFVPGARILVRWTVGGSEVTQPFFTVREVVPERRIAFEWVPYEIPEGEDPASHPTTRIEMTLEAIADGTRLTVVESGFASLPPDKRYKRDENGQGWAVQVQAIARHVLGAVDVRLDQRVARPVGEVFAAIAATASAPLTPGARVGWTFAGARVTAFVQQVEADRRVVFVWAVDDGPPTKVTLAVEPDGAGTRVTAVETPFALSPESAARAIARTRDWTRFGCALAARLEHGIELRG